MSDNKECKAYSEFVFLIKDKDRKLDKIAQKEFQNTNQLLYMIQEYNKANNMLMNHYDDNRESILCHILSLNGK